MHEQSDITHVVGKSVTELYVFLPQHTGRLQVTLINFISFITSSFIEYQHHKIYSLAMLKQIAQHGSFDS